MRPLHGQLAGSPQWSSSASSNALQLISQTAAHRHWSELICQRSPEPDAAEEAAPVAAAGFAQLLQAEFRRSVARSLVR